eukprot:3957401-Pyramimonas_sp.AAC.1
MGHLRAIFGASMAVVNASETKSTRMPQIFVFRKEWDDFGILGLSWEVLQGRLGSLLACLGGFWGRR